MNNHIRNRWIKELMKDPTNHPYNILERLYREANFARVSRMYNLFTWSGVKSSDAYWVWHTRNLNRDSRNLDENIKVILSL